MKVLLELLGDTSRVLENVDDLEDFRPESRDRVAELLDHLARESERILTPREVTPGEADPRGPILDEVLEAISKGDYERARERLQAGLERFPRDFELLNHLGLVAWEQGDLREAEEVYGRAIEVVFGDCLSREVVEGAVDPALRAVEGRALALYRLGEGEEALRYFMWLGQEFPSQYVGCRYLAGEILHLQGSPEEALQWYDQVPVEPAVLYNRGLALYQLNEVEEAIRSWLKAFVANIHVANQLLGRHTPRRGCTPGYLGSERYAREFVEACRRLWFLADGSLHALAVCFDHQRVQEHLRQCSRRGGQRLLQGSEGSMNCHGFLDQLQDDQSLSEMAGVVRRRLLQ